jgi:hypothetical protein
MATLPGKGDVAFHLCSLNTCGYNLEKHVDNLLTVRKASCSQCLLKEESDIQHG